MKNPFLLLCLYGLLIASCEKEASNKRVVLEPVDSSSVFNLVASDSACMITIVNGSFFNGSFFEGKPLTRNQNIQIEVIISKAGKCSFSTDTLNGFSFAESGVFADTGKQLITLNARGTSVITGNFFFSLTKGSLKRFISIAVIKSDIFIETVPLKSYFKGTIGGVKYYVEAPTIGPDDIPYGRGGRDTVSFSSFLGPRTYPNPPGTGTISLQKGFMYNYSTSMEDDFKHFFQPGAYAFNANKCPNIFFPGIILFWNDSDNQGWGTQKVFGDQTGSSFTIVGIEDGHNNKGNYFVKVKSRFNCKLYNLRSGEMKELTDGELVSFFIK